MALHLCFKVHVVFLGFRDVFYSPELFFLSTLYNISFVISSLVQPKTKLFTSLNVYVLIVSGIVKMFLSISGLFFQSGVIHIQRKSEC